jgi:cellulose synthase/poly-beta-1,6-N-acetylglucosamine synthase-like glycosyltransferase/CheY-like chemotaxis protein
MTLLEDMISAEHLCAERPSEGSVLVVDDEERIRKMMALTLGRIGFEVTVTSDGAEALECARRAAPDLILSDVMMPGMDGLEMLRQLRSDPLTRAIPVILLTGCNAPEDVVAGLGLGADDYLAKPFDMAELLARVRAKVERPPLPKDALPQDRQTGLLSERRLLAEVEREIARAARGGHPGCLAYLDLAELPRLRERLGARVEAEIARQVAALIQEDAGRLELAGRDRQGRFLLLLPDTSGERAQQRLEALSRWVGRDSFTVGRERVRLTPALGYAVFSPGATVEELREQALLALNASALQLDMHPVRYSASMAAHAGQEEAARLATEGTASHRVWRVRLSDGWRLALQIAATLVIGLVFPFFLYVAWGAAGIDISGTVYLIIVLAMLGTSILITVEACLALRRIDPPEEPRSPYPPASAIIAAYLPNEAPIIVETIQSFLDVEYPAPLQVILAYNTPRDLPVEAVLREMAERDPRLLVMRVENSTSKAQNVNAAVAEVTGEFVGVFDADHHPESTSFTRAWRWLSNGYDVVQGHCLVRNGDASWVSRMVAVEFESMYAVSHPGRARLHGFGLFGGSNGYWRTEVLRETRMRGWMLTEDIDSSMRLIAAGHRLGSDPYLISRELEPVTLKTLWHQRMRWAQGWCQISYHHTERALRSPHLSLRQKLGMMQLLAWREMFPWLSLQILPILAYWVLWQGRVINWFVPFFVFATLVMLSNRPLQLLFTYMRAHPEIRRHKGWFVSYFLLTLLFYLEFKNLISRVAHMKELMRERAWIVTPRERASQG